MPPSLEHLTVPNPLASMKQDETHLESLLFDNGNDLEDMNTFLVNLLDKGDVPALPVSSALTSSDVVSSQVSLEDPMMTSVVSPVTSSSVSPTNGPVLLQSFSSSSSSSKLMLTSAFEPVDEVTSSIKTSCKKRRLLDIAPNSGAKKARSVSTAEESTVKKAEDDDQVKRERNRFHAQQSRMRKKNLQQDMHDVLMRMKQENALLRQHIAGRYGDTSAATSLLQARKDEHTATFIQQLQTPKNRVVKGKTLRFLRRLRKNLPASSVYKAVEDAGVATSTSPQVAALTDSYKKAATSTDPFQVVA